MATNGGDAAAIPPLDIQIIAPAIDTNAPVIFADYLASSPVINGVVRLGFAQNFGEPTDSVQSQQRAGWHARYSAVIAIPLLNLEQTAIFLTEAVANYRALGVLPPKVEPSGD